MKHITPEDYFDYYNEEFIPSKDLTSILTEEFVLAGHRFLLDEGTNPLGVYFKLIAQLYTVEKEEPLNPSALAYMHYLVAYYLSSLSSASYENLLISHHITQALALEEDEAFQTRCQELAAGIDDIFQIGNIRKLVKQPGELAGLEPEEYFDYDNIDFFPTEELVPILTEEFVLTADSEFMREGIEPNYIYFKLLAHLYAVEKEDPFNPSALAYMHYLIAYYIGLFAHPNCGDWLALHHVDLALALDEDEDFQQQCRDVASMVREEP